jgi:hypothetical protein
MPGGTLDVPLGFLGGALGVPLGLLGDSLGGFVGTSFCFFGGSAGSLLGALILPERFVRSPHVEIGTPHRPKRAEGTAQALVHPFEYPFEEVVEPRSPVLRPEAKAPVTCHPHGRFTRTKASAEHARLVHRVGEGHSRADAPAVLAMELECRRNARGVPAENNGGTARALEIVDAARPEGRSQAQAPSDVGHDNARGQITRGEVTADVVEPHVSAAICHGGVAANAVDRRFVPDLLEPEVSPHVLDVNRAATGDLEVSRDGAKVNRAADTRQRDVVAQRADKIDVTGDALAAHVAVDLIADQAAVDLTDLQVSGDFLASDVAHDALDPGVAVDLTEAHVATDILDPQVAVDL